ncbi:MAG: SpoIIE family protein phosphatase [Desulfatibacillum sp.]|nr:SpoIIE family protein phosphatase [Desulfatibacillum sp.]
MESAPILIADDDEGIRNLLIEGLSAWGYQVLVAKDGEEAWEILKSIPVWLVISDWMMPGMDGPELCRRIRSASFPFYVYVILLTAKSQKDDLLQGMAAGADDFMNKPFGMAELRARISAAERILRLERSLEEKNAKLQEVNDQLQRANDMINKDMEAAAWIQQSLLPNPGTIYGLNFDSLFIPCSVVGGDIFNYFPVGKHHLAFYSLDVSGHGIPAAMLSVTVNKTITTMPFHEARFFSGSDGSDFNRSISPASMARELNLLFQRTETVEQYFTMVYGIVDRRNGNIILTQAGHPYPILVPAQGEARLLGSGGLPVGLLPDAEFTEDLYRIEPGDRLFLYSDGITDCTNEKGERFSQEKLVNFLSANRDCSLNRLIRKMGEELMHFHGSHSFDDDVSLMVMERIGDERINNTERLGG